MKRILTLTTILFIGAFAFAEAPADDGFEMDRILHVGGETSDAHYHLFVPKGYDGKVPYALYITLPGYEGYYFQGVGANLRNERFAVAARSYNPKMIVAAPQPEDWVQNSMRQTIALTEYFLHQYNIDKSKVYISGFSGGGETMSLAVSERPDLYTAALHISSRWDGSFTKLVAARTPVYFAIGESDEYYSSRPAKDAYAALRSLYQAEGLSDRQIARLAVLDVKDGQYFKARNAINQHGGGALFAYDRTVMGWLFGEH